MLAQYDDVVPGAAERIMRMAESSTTDQADLQREGMRAAIRLDWQTFLVGGVLSVLAFISAIVLVVLGYPWGLGMLSLTLGMLLNESRKRRSGW